MGERVDKIFSEGDGSVMEGAAIAAEAVTGIVLAVFLTFFMFRDGALSRRGRSGRRGRIGDRDSAVPLTAAGRRSVVTCGERPSSGSSRR